MDNNNIYKIECLDDDSSDQLFGFIRDCNGTALKQGSSVITDFFFKDHHYELVWYLIGNTTSDLTDHDLKRWDSIINPVVTI